MSPRDARVVYSTGKGSVCPKCGWPADDCRCSTRAGAGEAVPATITAVLRLEKKGRGGKTVTIVAGLPRNAAFLEELARDLKRACATGGAVRDDSVELQGDRREVVRPLLAGRGWRVKG